jgi:polysaccharide pyruvyl transferase WcaK-like protein
MKINEAKKNSVLLLGAYGRKNLGDDIYLHVILERLGDRCVYFNCWNLANLPSDIKLKPKHQPFATRIFKDMGIKLQALIKSRIIIYGGGELWMRFHANSVKNVVLYKMLLVNCLFRLLRKKIYYISVGAEELSGWSLLLAKGSAMLADKIYFRDKKSAYLLGMNKNRYLVVPDLVLLAKIPPQGKAAVDYIGLSMLYDIGPKFDREEYWLNLAHRLRHSGMPILPLPAMDDRNYTENDHSILMDFFKRFELKYDDMHYESIAQLTEAISRSVIVVSSRLHISLIALMCEVPTIAVGYKPKVLRIFNNLGLDKCCYQPGSIPFAINSKLAEDIRLKEEQAFIKVKSLAQSASNDYADFFKVI